MTERVTERAFPQLAEKLFNTYNEQGPNPWKTWDGKDVPKWGRLGNQVTAKWMAVALEAMRATGSLEMMEGAKPT